MKTVADRIFAALERCRDDERRSHLGASFIGRPCARDVWYSLRWATDVKHHGRVLRIFRRGQEEEAKAVDDLERAGFVVVTHDSRGRQFKLSGRNSHVGGSVDGLIRDTYDEEAGWSVLEVKTHNVNNFKDLKKKGLKASKYHHWAQLQLYMLWFRLPSALYLAVNKNDDSIYTEWVALDRLSATELDFKAEEISLAKEPPLRISERPDWYQCKMCDHYQTCHQGKPIEEHCRTCVRVEPVPAGWYCQNKQRLLNIDEQKIGCDEYDNPANSPEGLSV